MIWFLGSNPPIIKMILLEVFLAIEYSLRFATRILAEFA